MFFKDIIGNQQLISRLLANAGSGRIPHAQLFAGPDDYAPTAFALAYARYILCRKRGAEDACGSCPSCLKVDKLIHPDLHFFFPSATNHEHKKEASSKLFLSKWRELVLKNPFFSYHEWLEQLVIENKQAIINAEDCNDIIRTLGVKSYESVYKIILIYKAEKIFYAAAPKLLKVLEEPPPNTLFLMIADNMEQMLKTILSRTQVHPLSAPGEDQIEHALKERYQIAPDKARQVAFLSGGSITRALSMTRDGAGQLADMHAFRDWMRFCFAKNVVETLNWVEQVSKHGREKQKSFFQYGLRFFRLCLLNNYKAATLIRSTGEEEDFVQKFSPFFNHNNALQITEAFNDAVFHLERNANSKLLFADLSFQMMRLLHAGSR